MFSGVISSMCSNHCPIRVFEDRSCGHRIGAALAVEETRRREGQSIVGLHDGDAHEVSRRARRRARRDSRSVPQPRRATRRSSHPSRPSCGTTGRTPPSGIGASTPKSPERARQQLEARAVDRRAGTSTCSSSPYATATAAWIGPATMKPACWRTARRYAHELGVAGVEAGAHPGQVRALRDRVHGQHARRGRARGSARGRPAQVNSA